jgi:hypothetical protein
VRLVCRLEGLKCGADGVGLGVSVATRATADDSNYRHTHPYHQPQPQPQCASDQPGSDSHLSGDGCKLVYGLAILPLPACPSSSPPVGQQVRVSFGVGRKTPALATLMTTSLLLPVARRTLMPLAGPLGGSRRGVERCCHGTNPHGGWQEEVTSSA